MQPFNDGSAVTSVLGRNRSTLRKSMVSGCLLGSFVVLSASAHAAVKTWDGGGATSNFSDGINWADDTAPVAGDSLVFAGTNKLTPVNDLSAGIQFSGLGFDATAGAFVVSGAPISLSGDLTDTSTATETVNLPMTLLQNITASVTTVNSTLVVNNPGVTATATATLTSGSVSGATITAGGSGYFPNSTFPIFFSAPPAAAAGQPANVTATGTATTDATGVVVSIAITNGGSGYVAAPTITIPSPASVTEDATPRALTKVGTGTLVLSARNTFSGGLNINGGVVSLAAPAAIGQQGAGLGTITFNNSSTLTLNGFTGQNSVATGNLGNALVVPAGAVGRLNTSQRGSVSSVLTGAGSFTVNTAFIRSDFTANFTGFTGIITLAGSDFRLLTNTVFGPANNVVIGVGANPFQTFNPPNSGTVSTIQTIGELSGVAGSFIGGQPVAGRFFNLTVGARNTNSTFAGVIRDNPGGTRLTKVGTGTLTLTGPNTHTGGTVVTGGTIAGTGALGTGASFATGTTHAPGIGNIPMGSQAVNGPYALNDGSTLRIGSQNAQVAVVGTVTLTGTVTLSVASGFASNVGDKFTIINNDGTDAVVGTFAGLAEGATLTSTDGTTFTISYVGGDGNDVVLTVVTPGSATASPSSFAKISEFRTSGPAGVNDEFIEISNSSEAPLDLNGFSVVAGGVTIPIPAGRVLPTRGRLLLTNSTATTGYSLAAYAAGDIAFVGDIADGSTIALKSATNVVLDQVNAGSLPAPLAVTDNYSYVRRLDSGLPLDTGNDQNDFNTVDVASTNGPNNTTGISNNLLRLGAPGPENLTSPISNNSLITFTPTSSLRVGSGNSGTLALRYLVTNKAGTGRVINALRFRVVAVTAGATTPADAAPADLRLISSTSNNGTILPLVLQQPPTQALGGGLNSTVSLANLPGGGLAPGQSLTVELLFNVAQKGTYRFLLNTETVTTSTP